MAFFLTITLLVSAAFLTLLIAVKRFEMRRKRVVFARLRPTVAGALHAALLLVEHILPSLVRRMVYRAWVVARRAAGAVLARAVLFFERRLVQVLELMHYKMQPARSSGEVSTFLKEVAEHKRKLLRRAPHKRMILDEY